MLVKVTQEHIDKAEENIKNSTDDYPRSCNCPVAAALKETFKVLYTRATYHDLFIGQFPNDSLIFETKTPLEVKEWMNNFDMAKTEENSFPVQPFEFELSLEGVKLCYCLCFKTLS